MASFHSQNHRRRSHSASPSSPSARSPDKSWRAATKRAYPHHAFLGKDASSAQKWDVDVWRRGKRRRQDTPKLPPFVLSDKHNATEPPVHSFATTSSDFHLFSRRERDNKGRARRSKQSLESRPMELDDVEHGDLTSLSHLRSNAFWELHRSVAEDGEGLLQRMRDYEHSRSRSDVYLKAKEAQKRGRKRSSLAASSRRLDFPHHKSDGEEDDVLIYAGELPPISPPGRPCPKKRSISLDLMDEDTRDYEFTTGTSQRSLSPGATCDSGSSIYHSDDENFHSSGTTSPFAQSLFSSSPPQPFATSFAPGLPNALSDSMGSSPVSLPLRSLSPPAPSSPVQSPAPNALSSYRSEKAIAALSLAMANGAGGIADYEAVLAIQTTPLFDGCQVGELWH
ncbi:hypothetical protein FPV67DRAFT_56754 [Lyophyllum atratum]|nr:hypothetical protein FPV67DRAFT_56754 [Lyophyllum atratum]